MYADPETLIAERLHQRLDVKVWADPRLPVDWNFNAPLVHVQRAPGDGDPALTLDVAVLDIDVWSAVADHARTVAEQVRTEMRLHLPLHTFPGGTFVNGVTTVMAPTWLPDPKVHRRSATYRVVLHTSTF